MSESHVRTAQVKGKSGIKKISGAIYSEQTTDKTWQGQVRKKKKRTEQIHHAQAALI